MSDEHAIALGILGQEISVDVYVLVGLRSIVDVDHEPSVA
jgi:hypothetical protein